MPSAANGKPEKPTSSEASTENLSPVRQIMVILDHKIRNLEKRKSKLTSYRDLQKSGKELNADQKVAVAKYDEVALTLDFARDLSKQVNSICATSEKEAKKQAKKDAWLKAASETNKIRDVLLVLDCLIQLGSHEIREDFMNGSKGAAKLTEEDIKILDDLYPEVTPKHENLEDGTPSFPSHALRAAEHLCCIVDGKQKDFVGSTYARIKEIVTTVHECGYLDKSHEDIPQEPEINHEFQENECVQDAQEEHEPEEESPPPLAPLHHFSPPPPGAYPMRPMPPITLQEVEHAYFAQQYAQQRPISDVIGTQGFFFLQESEIDSPIPTPQPPPNAHLPQPPPNAHLPQPHPNAHLPQPTALPLQPQIQPQLPIPTQTFTNQNFLSRAAPAAGALPMPGAHLAAVPPPPHFVQPLQTRVETPPMILQEQSPTPQPPPTLQSAQQQHPQQQQDQSHSPHSAASPERNGHRSNSRYNEGSRENGRLHNDNGFRDSGSKDNGPRDNRYRDNGYRDNGGRDNGARDNEPRDNGRFRRFGRGGPRGGHSDGYRSGNRTYQNGNGRDYSYRNGDGGDGDRYPDRERDSEPRYDSFKSRGGRGGGRGGPRGAPSRRPHSNNFSRRPAATATE